MISGNPDPAHKGSSDAERRAAFEEAYQLLEMRVAAMVALPVEDMNIAERREALARIGSMTGATELALGGGQ